MKKLILCLITVMLVLTSPVIGKGPTTVVTGTFFIDTAFSQPTAGEMMRFLVQTSPIPSDGRYNTYAWVDVNCVANGVQVIRNMQIAVVVGAEYPGGDGVYTYAYAPLAQKAWGDLGYPGGVCTSFLFWDSVHRTTRTNSNTIAGPLTFVAAPGL